MISKGIQAFSGKRVLLLQGPVGPFFARLAKDLRGIGAQVHKINFNAGDWVWYPRGAVHYRGTMQDWPTWFEAWVRQHDIDAVLLFGDCRPVHRAAHEVATRLGLEIGVFEEGYIRPDHVTLERFGVNGFSQIPRTPEEYQAYQLSAPTSLPVGKSYRAMAFSALVYFLFACLGKVFFPHYQHHRRISFLEAWPWIRSAWRKHVYCLTERGVQESLTGEFSKRYFLVPLQVFNDAQILVHAPWANVDEFIAATMRSFAKHAPEDCLLVFKHHPMDRGYVSYKKHIQKLAAEHDIAMRVRYIHDQHLPSLLDHARGVVVVNSTVGLSALHHNAPTKTCGTALYDMPGLTYQGSLDEFWLAAPMFKQNRTLYEGFRAYLLANTQINGSFYKPLKLPGSAAGLVWNAHPRSALLVRRKTPAPAMIAGETAWNG